MYLSVYLPCRHLTTSFRRLILRGTVHIHLRVSDCSLTEGAAFVLCAFHGAIRQHLEVEAVSAVESRDDALQLGLCRANTGLKGVSIQERAHAHQRTPIINACTAICDFNKRGVLIFILRNSQTVKCVYVCLKVCVCACV